MNEHHIRPLENLTFMPARPVATTGQHRDVGGTLQPDKWERPPLRQLADRVGARFNGVQVIPGIPDQWVFTDNVTHSTIYVRVDSSEEEILTAMTRMRAKFAAAEKMWS